MVRPAVTYKSTWHDYMNFHASLKLLLNSQLCLVVPNEGSCMSYMLGYFMHGKNGGLFI